MTRDTWVGLVVLAAAVLYWIGADGIRISPLDGPVTAQGLPKALAYALGLLAVLLILRSQVVTRLAAKAAATSAAQPGVEPTVAEAVESVGRSATWQQHLRAAVMLGLGVGYLVIVPYLGYTLSIGLLLLGTALYIGAKFGPKTLAFAVIGGVFFYLLFVQFLHIPLPAGLWAGVLRSLQG